MVRTSRITGGGADSSVSLFDQVLAAKVLIPAIAPIRAGSFVKVLRKGLRQAVGQRLNHRRTVGIVFDLILTGELFNSMSGCDREGPYRVLDSGLLRSDKVGQAKVDLALAFVCLLP